MRTPRGSALLAALSVLVVLALVTMATLQLASLSRGSAILDSRKLTQASCVEAARQHVLGRLRVFGLDPTSIQLDQAVQVDSGTRQLRTGHISAPSVTSVRAIPPNLVGGSGARNRDMSNLVVPSPTLGGKYYRVVVACTDPAAGDMELEFTFRYGL
jgi:hypothetical protein